MPNTVLGKVSLTPRGAYSAEVAYTALDLVGHENGGYIALQSVQGVTPSDDGVNWMLLAGQGGTGPQGVQGPPGAVYTPTVSPEGVISWTNSGDLTNPDPVDITGPAGPTGATGASVASIERTSGTGAPGTTDTYTVKLTDGSTAGTFQVYNGADGTGAGDFKADGTVPMTGDLQMGGNRVTGLGSAQDATDAVNKTDLDTAIAGAADLTLSNLTNPQQALANLGAGVRPRLGINMDFKINQRGQSSYSASGKTYTVDGWYLALSGGSLTVNEDSSITLGAENNTFWQLIPPDEFELGKPFTFSVLTAEGALYSVTADSLSVSTDQKEDTDFGYIRIQYYNGNVGVNVNPTQSVTLAHAKPEQGPNQTLAYQDADGAWEILPQPDADYGAQLAQCQRYLVVLRGYGWIGSGVMDSSTQGQFFIPLPVTMRTVPTISGTVRIYNYLNNLEATEISAASISSNGIHGFFKIGSGSTLSSGDAVFLWLNTDEQLIISAEL